MPDGHSRYSLPFILVPLIQNLKMQNMRTDHPDRVANLCRHILHPSAPSRARWCSQCVISAAQAGLEEARKRLEAEGGANAPMYMRDRAWNIARLRYAARKRGVEKAMQGDLLRRERERLWDEAHQWYLAQHGHIPPHMGSTTGCVVCAAMKNLGQPYIKPVVPLTTAWWEREGALMKKQVLPLKPPPRSRKRKQCPPQPQVGRQSYRGDFIKSWRSMRTVSDAQRRIWEDRCKLDRAIRRKYDLPDDYELEPDIFTHPLPASHAKYHHRQIQNGEHAAERRANRHKRRAEDYRPSRSSLALFELANDVNMDETEAEKLRAEEEATELRWMTDAVAAEVGYLYFVGEMGLLEQWGDEFEHSRLDLVHRNIGSDMYVGRVDGEHVETEEETEEL